MHQRQQDILLGGAHYVGWCALPVGKCLYFLMTSAGQAGNTKRQRTSHRTYTTEKHKFTLTLTPPSLQTETTNVVINIIVASS